MESSHKKDILIVGGGITGLSTAYYLSKTKADFVLLEGQKDVGGTIQTIQKQGCTLEAGPDSFVSTKPWARELCEELGLEKDLLPPNPKAKTLFVLQKRKLKPLPTGLSLGIPTKISPFIFNRTLPVSTKIRMAMEYFYPPKDFLGDEALGHFMTRHFGQKAFELLIDPLLGGIYASNTDHLSLQATFPQFQQMEKKYGSLIRGFKRLPKRNGGPPFLTLKEGMASLPNRLREKIPEHVLLPNHKVQKIFILGDFQGFKVLCENQKTFISNHLVLALPPKDIPCLLPGDLNLSSILRRFQSTSTAVIFLAFPMTDHLRKINGFGFIAPRKESNLLACSFVSKKFPWRSREDVFLIRSFIGGQGREDVLKKSEPEIVFMVKQEIMDILGVSHEPIFSKIFPWVNQNPVYSLDQAERVRNLQNELKEIPNLHLIGNHFGGVGIPDCIRQGKECAQKLSI